MGSGFGLGMALIKRERNPLVLDATRGDWPDFVTRTRASTRWYFNASGVLVSAANNVIPREYDPVTLALKGWILEDQRINRLLHNRAFDNVVWTKVTGTVSANVEVAIDGQTVADVFIPDNAVSGAYVEQAITGGTVANGTLSVVARFTEGLTELELYFDSGAGADTCRATFDLSNGTISVAAAVTGTWTTPSAVIENYGNGGWYRCQIRCVPATTAPTRARLIFPGVGNGATGIALDWAQYETDPFASSVMETGAATFTRPRDVAQITGAKAADIINRTEGTLVYEGNYAGIGTVSLGRQIMALNGSAGYILFYDGGGVNQTAFRINDDTPTNWAHATVAITKGVGDTIRFAGRYGIDNVRQCTNGVLSAGDTSVDALPATTKVDFSPTLTFMHMRKARVYRKALTDSQLRVLAPA